MAEPGIQRQPSGSTIPPSNPDGVAPGSSGATAQQSAAKIASSARSGVPSVQKTPPGSRTSRRPAASGGSLSSNRQFVSDSACASHGA